MVSQVATPGVKWIGNAFDKKRFSGDVTGNTWVVSRVISERQGPEPIEAQTPRWTVYKAECNLLDAPESPAKAIVTISMQVPNLFSTLPSHLQNDDYLESPSRHQLEQYMDPTSYRERVRMMVNQDPKIFRSQAVPEVNYRCVHEWDVLEHLTDSGSSCTPKLILAYDRLQRDNEWVPGGFFQCIVTTKVPGYNVGERWDSLSRQQRRKITALTKSACDEISSYSLSAISYKNALVFDPDREKVYITNTAIMCWCRYDPNKPMRVDLAELASDYGLEPPIEEEKEEAKEEEKEEKEERSGLQPLTNVTNIPRASAVSQFEE